MALMGDRSSQPGFEGRDSSVRATNSDEPEFDYLMDDGPTAYEKQPFHCEHGISLNRICPECAGLRSANVQTSEPSAKPEKSGNAG
jgi:hypothetical protein